METEIKIQGKKVTELFYSAQVLPREYRLMTVSKPKPLETNYIQLVTLFNEKFIVILFSLD